jgi:hypothetical protein
MLRPLAAVCAVLALAACGHQAAASRPPQPPPPSQDGATLGAYVMDATPTSPAPPTPGTGQRAAGQPAGKLPVSACAQGQDAYKVLVFLVSSDTGTSIQTIVADLTAGQSLADIAGGKTDLVERQAMDLVQAWLQFSEANGTVSADQEVWYRSIAIGVIGGLMTANVTSCIPSTG